MKTSYYNTTNILNLPRVNTIKDNDYIVIQDSNNNTKTTLLQYKNFMIGLENITFNNVLDGITTRVSKNEKDIADLYNKINEVPPEPEPEQRPEITFDKIYPVGSIYMSLEKTNPTVFFGGSWSKIENMFLLGASSTYPLNDTGGEPEHTLIEGEMPSHRHGLDFLTNSTIKGVDWDMGGGNWSNYPVDNPTTNSAGGNQPHNNMPPYLAVNIWERTG